jgi:hypothetical protein
MDPIFPKTKLTRGTLSATTLLAMIILLLIPAAFLIRKWLFDGIQMSGVSGLLLVIAAMPYAFRWQDYFTGRSHLFFCDEMTLAIKEARWKMHFLQLEDLQRMVHDRSGYTLVLKNGCRFRMLHKDAEPQHSAMLKHWHASLHSSA